jgi:hypothetical protein
MRAKWKSKSLAPVPAHVAWDLEALPCIGTQVAIENAEKAQHHRVGAVHSYVLAEAEPSQRNHSGRAGRRIEVFVEPLIFPPSRIHAHAVIDDLAQNNVGVGSVCLAMPVMDDAEISRAPDWRFGPGRIYPRTRHAVRRDSEPGAVHVVDVLDLNAHSNGP